jgi:hypothetical protein
MIAPLWQRALDNRLDERYAARRRQAQEAGRKGGFSGGRRKYPIVAVGQRHGCGTVTRLLGRGHCGRSDMRVEIECACGRVRRTYEFMLRKYPERCRHLTKRPGTVTRRT